MIEHRCAESGIGQIRGVEVISMITMGTIEERILRMQEESRR